MKEITQEEALKIYQAGPEAVVKVICELSKYPAMVDKLTKHIEILEARIKELENRLAQNSRNSSKPPGSDGFHKPAPKSLRSPSGRKPGGQIGHEGHTLEMVENPDYVHINKLRGWCPCGTCLKNLPVADYERRQVFDIPIRPMEVTEYRVEIKQCPGCGRRHKGSFPETVKAPVQHSSRIKSMVVYLRTYQLLPAARSAELFKDLFGCEISPGVMDCMLSEGSDRLKDCVDWIKEQVKNSPVAQFDETGVSVDGDNHWLHAASTEKFTHYDIHPKRGTAAMDEIGILPEFRGHAIHDSLPAYFQYDQCQHNLCNAHHLRELTFVNEQLGQAWAKAMIDCLIKIKDKVDTAKIEGLAQLSKGQQDYWRREYRDILIRGYQANPCKDPPREGRKRGRPAKGKALCLIERLDEHWRKVLGFMHDFRIPFDNNLSERDVRMMKVRQKISGTFRSIQMAKTFCRLRSYISTVRKQNFHLMDTIELIFTGRPLKLFVP